MSLPCLYTRYFLLYLSTGSASEFVCSHLYARQSILYASGFAFLRCIPLPGLLFNQPYKTDPFCKSHKWLLCKIWLTSYILNIHLSVYTAGSKGQRLFFCALCRACHLKRCHYQPHSNDIGNTTSLQLGGKLASRGWGLNSSWQRNNIENQLSLCLQNPKGYLETPVQTQIVYTSNIPCNGWFSLANNQRQVHVLVLAATFSSMWNKVHDLILEAG